MRTAFIKELQTLAHANGNISLVVGDLGYSVVEDFARAYPDRFLNAGVAEQNMTGVAAGLALGGGFTVFTYSIANFSTMRCLEQIRNDVCYHHADVKVVIVGGGVAYGTHGFTHFAVEDLAVMRAMPGMVVAVPADPMESAAITRLASSSPGPWYIRLGRNGEPRLHASDLADLKLGAMLQLREGSDGVILACGPIVAEALKAAEADTTRSIAVYSVPFIKPLDREALLSAIAGAKWVLSVEEHGPFGGFGSALAEVLVDTGRRLPFKRLHFPEFIPESGSQEYLRSRLGLDAVGIAAAIEKLAT